MKTAFFSHVLTPICLPAVPSPSHARNPPARQHLPRSLPTTAAAAASSSDGPKPGASVPLSTGLSSLFSSPLTAQTTTASLPSRSPLPVARSTPVKGGGGEWQQLPGLSSSDNQPIPPSQLNQKTKEGKVYLRLVGVVGNDPNFSGSSPRSNDSPLLFN